MTEWRARKRRFQWTEGDQVARYAKEHKQATRQRIVETAGRRFKRDGIDGAGIATLMSDAGLTNGAFYAHFGSKDDLVASTVADQLHRQEAELQEQVAKPAGLVEFIRDYLSVQHRDDPEGGCPSAALLDEIGRGSAATKQAYTDGVLSVVDAINAQVTVGNPQQARVQALSLFAMLVGTLQLSRALADRELADQVLDQGIENALKLLGDSAGRGESRPVAEDESVR